MKITSIAPWRGSTLAVETDDEQTFYFHRDLIADYGLRSGVEITPERLAEVEAAALYRRAYERALYLLDARAHTYYELFQKLAKSYPRDTCRAVVRRLAELHILNDRACAQSLARSYVEVKKYGLRRVAMELRHRGLSDAIIEEALAPYRDDVDERLAAVLEKKYARVLTDPTDRAAVNRVKAALARRGYGFSEIQAAIAAYFAEQSAQEEDFDDAAE